VEEKLKGQKFRQQDVRDALLQIDLKEYFGSISLKDILSLF
jgi:lipoate-protein ligase A